MAFTLSFKLEFYQWNKASPCKIVFNVIFSFWLVVAIWLASNREVIFHYLVRINCVNWSGKSGISDLVREWKYVNICKYIK